MFTPAAEASLHASPLPVESENSKVQTRNALLDLSRFVAAIAVLLYHLAFRAHTEVGVVEEAFGVFDQWVRYGYLGVPFFFMISGYVILMTVSRQNTWRGFVASRAARLYPAYWVALLITAFFTFAMAGELGQISLSQIVVNLSMLQTFLGVAHIDGVYWSLTVEVVFYGWIALMIACGQSKNFEVFALFALFIAAVQTIAPLPSLLYVVLIPEWSCYFVAGAFFYLIQAKGLNLSRAVILALSFALSMIQTWRYTERMGELYSAEFSHQTALLLVSSFYCFFIINQRTKTSVRIPSVTTLGAMSYPVYLLHQNIGYLVLDTYATADNQYWVLCSIIAAV